MTDGLVKRAWVLGATVGLVGCVVPPAGKGPAKTSKQGEPSPVVDAATGEDSDTPQQDTLAAVEEFLARTQDYRVPAKGEAGGSISPASTAQIASTARPEASRPAAAPAVQDAAYATAQISVSDAAPPAAPPQAVPALQGVSVRAAAPSTSMDTPVRNKTTNAPIELQSKERSDASEALLTVLKDELGRKGDAATAWKLQTLMAVLDRDLESAAAGTNLSSDEAEVIRGWNEAATSVRNYLRSSSQSPDEAVAKLEALRNVLSVKTEPRVRSVALCRKVVTFGSYEEMAGEEFVSGRSIQTIVYAEIENLRTRESAGVYETKLATRLEVLTGDGKSMWQREEPEVVDKCRRPRRDFFVAQRVTLPPTLPQGDYVLKFSIEDKISGQIAESSVAFDVRSPVSVANGQ